MPLPSQFWSMKPKDVMMDAWIWEHKVADWVFHFSGNHIVSWEKADCTFCCALIWLQAGTTLMGLTMLLCPGGDRSTHSLRKWQAVLQAILHYDKNKGSEYVVLIGALCKLNQYMPGHFHLGAVNEMLKFGGSTLVMDNDTLHENYEKRGPPLILSGTHAQLPWKVRDALLGICPEWKVIFHCCMIWIVLRPLQMQSSVLPQSAHWNPMEPVVEVKVFLLGHIWLKRVNHNGVMIWILLLWMAFGHLLTGKVLWHYLKQHTSYCCTIMIYLHVL